MREEKVEEKENDESLRCFEAAATARVGEEKRKKRERREREKKNRIETRWEERCELFRAFSGTFSPTRHK